MDAAASNGDAAEVIDLSDHPSQPERAMDTLLTK